MARKINIGAKDLAALTGLTDRTIRKYKADGRLRVTGMKGKGDLYDLDESAAELDIPQEKVAAFLIDRRRKKEEVTEEGIPALEISKAKKEHFMAIRAEQAANLEKGDLMQLDEHRRIVVESHRVVLQELMRSPEIVFKWATGNMPAHEARRFAHRFETEVLDNIRAASADALKDFK